MHQHNHSHEGLNSTREGNKKGLIIALVITAGIMVLEFIGGIFTNSLALLSDSGHMLSDTSSLALSLVAMWFATRPPSPNKTYGFYRFEILAALFNGITLFVIAGFIIKEAIARFYSPPEVLSGTMIIIASIGLVANILSAWALLAKGDVKENLNVRSAYLHIIGDALGSIGAIIAGLLILLYGWNIVDPIISVVVALLILKSAFGVIKSTLHILMEGTPATVNFVEVKRILENIEGVKNVHDLHVWTISSGIDSLSCHLLIADDKEGQEILQQAVKILAEEFKILHTTIQVENSELKHPELYCNFCEN